LRIEFNPIKEVITQVILLFNQPYDSFESKKHRLIFSFGIFGFVWFFLFTFGVFQFDYFPFPDRFYNYLGNLKRPDDPGEVALKGAISILQRSDKP